MEEKDFLRSLAGLPQWAATTVLVALTVAALVPKVLSAWRAFNRPRRFYEKEKLRLQVLKLRYEVEAFRKEKGLEDYPVAAIGNDPESIVKEGGNLAPHSAPSSARLVRFLLGALGGALPQVLTLVTKLVFGRPAPGSLLAIAFGTAVLSLIAGGLALLLSNRATPSWACVLLGFSASLTLTTLIQAGTQPEPRVPSRMPS